MTTNELYNEIKKLRGAEVSYYGSIHKLESDFSDSYIIDTLDIIEALEDYESDVTIEDVIESYGDVNPVCNNSYNWSSPLSNDIDYRIYDVGYGFYDSKTYVEIAVHRYGDARCNYTDYILYEFDCVEEFYELLLESNIYDTIEVDGVQYDLVIDVLSDTIEVEGYNGDYFTIVASDRSEAIEAIKDETK